MILIGITDFNIVENNSNSFTMEKVYEYDMTENLSLDCYNCVCKYIKTARAKPSLYRFYLHSFCNLRIAF